MDKLLIRGGRTLQGEVLVSGAKNAALPELCAALLTAEPVTLLNVPQLQDVSTMLKLIRNMGVTAERADDGTVRIDASALNWPEAPYELVKTMRASVLALGPLLARFGEATVSLPGGCAIGSRPVDQHIKGMAAMGAEIVVEHGYMIAKLPAGWKRLKGARITTDMVTVTGTENFMMAAALAEGETVLENAAQEPEISDLAEMLIAMGAKIEGHGTSRIRIQGVEKLHGCTHRVVADRIEAGTFLCAVAATGCCAMAAPTTSMPSSKSCAKRAPRCRRWTAASACKALAAPRSRPRAFAPPNTPVSLPTCRRSSWRSTALPRARPR